MLNWFKKEDNTVDTCMERIKELERDYGVKYFEKGSSYIIPLIPIVTLENHSLTEIERTVRLYNLQSEIAELNLRFYLFGTKKDGYTLKIYKLNMYKGDTQMNDKEQILKRIENAEAELKQAKEALEKYNNTDWVPEIGEEYWCVNNMNKPDNFTYHFSCMADINRINNLNCFKTEEEAQQECEKIYVRRKLEQIARRLGVPSKEDWQNWRITKWYIGLNVEENKLSLNSNNNHKAASVTYCLSHEILKIAIKEIGEDRLIKYCKDV